MMRGYFNRMPVITRHPDAIRPRVSGNDRFGRTHARLIYPRDLNYNKRQQKTKTVDKCSGLPDSQFFDYDFPTFQLIELALDNVLLKYNKS